jgi:glutathione S-transferase
MASEYHIHGIELSPYSVKVRSYFRYKGIPHRWIPRSLDAEGEYQKFAKLPLVPLVVTPENEGIQDSTPIIEHVDALHPEPSIHPSDPVARFISVLLEEFGDEWGNKWMFHYRWAREADQLSGAGRIARSMMPTADDAQLANSTAMVRDRMVNRVSFVGSNPVTAPQIEESFRDTLAILEPHFASRAYMFGGRPAFADFAMWGQLYNAWTDPTPGAMINAANPNLLAWIHRMLWPRAEGNFEPWSSLAPTLTPLLDRQVAKLFMPWTIANAAALAKGSEEFTVELAGKTWTQKPQKYHAKSLSVLRAKYAALPDKTAIDAVLQKTGCLAGLRA